MKYMTKEELEQKDLISQFSVVDGKLVLNAGCEYTTNFNTGDIVVYKNDTTKVGVVSFIEEDELTIKWTNNEETTEAPSNLIIVPPTVGIELLEKSPLLRLWEELSNGKSEDFDLKCIYVGENVINEVPFVKAFKNTNTILDKKFKRTFTLHRKFGPTQIFKTSLYTISNGKVGIDASRYVYYLLKDNVVYYLGIDLNDAKLATYLFNK
ncbi:MAG: hypothetical protein ACRDA3_00815 [Peptostreptococcaceae bacterium]